MTYHPVKVLEDGTRVYSTYHRYKPMADEDRTNKVRKPADPRAVRFHGTWFLPLDLAPEQERQMPATRPDSDAYEHMSSNTLCGCEVCSRPSAEKVRRRWRRDNGLRP